MYRRPLDCPTIYQWDESSKQPLPPYPTGTAPSNCGVTVVTHIANYFNDKSYGIYATRRLVVWNDWQQSTSANEQSQMLWKRGVPNAMDRPTIRGLHNLLASGRRPVGIGMNFALVPPSIAGHPFRAGHGVELRANALRNGVEGFLAMDPNFNRTYRTDPTGGHRFYPNWVLEAAYYNAGYWAIVPVKDKLVPPPWWGRVRVHAGANIRESARDDISTNIFARSRSDGWTYATNGRRLWRNGYQYHWDGERVKEYLKVRTHGRDTKYIHRSHAVIERQP